MTYSDTFDPSQKQLAGYEAGIAAIVDYTGFLDNIVGGGPGMSSFVSSFATVGLIHMIYKYKTSSDKPKDLTTLTFTSLKAGLLSAIGDVALNGVLGSRIQNPRVLGALGTFLGTYFAEM